MRKNICQCVLLIIQKFIRVRLCQGKTKKELLNINYINNIFSVDNFKLIKGRDEKNYLAIEKIHNHYEYEGSVYLSIFNEAFELISVNEDYDDSFRIYFGGQTIILEDNILPWYKDNFILDKYVTRTSTENRSRLKIEDKK